MCNIGQVGYTSNSALRVFDSRCVVVVNHQKISPKEFWRENCPASSCSWWCWWGQGRALRDSGWTHRSALWWTSGSLCLSKYPEFLSAGDFVSKKILYLPPLESAPRCGETVSEPPVCRPRGSCSADQSRATETCSARKIWCFMFGFEADSCKISNVRICPFFKNWKQVQALIVPEREFLEWSEGSPGPQMPSTGPLCRRWQNLPRKFCLQSKESRKLTWVDEVFYHQSVVDFVSLVVAEQKFGNAQTKETWKKYYLIKLDLLGYVKDLWWMLVVVC